MYAVLPTFMLILTLAAYVGLIVVGIAIVGTFIYVRKIYILLRAQAEPKPGQNE